MDSCRRLSSWPSLKNDDSSKTARPITMKISWFLLKEKENGQSNWKHSITNRSTTKFFMVLLNTIFMDTNSNYELGFYYNCYYNTSINVYDVFPLGLPKSRQLTFLFLVISIVINTKEKKNSTFSSADFSSGAKIYWQIINKMKRTVVAFKQIYDNFITTFYWRSHFVYVCVRWDNSFNLMFMIVQSTMGKKKTDWGRTEKLMLHYNCLIVIVVKTIWLFFFFYDNQLRAYDNAETPLTGKICENYLFFFFVLQKQTAVWALDLSVN